MFLARSEIRRRLNQELLGGAKEPYIKQASYDLRLGPEVFIVGEAAPRKLTKEEPYISLPPGQFALLTCYEDVKIPDNVFALIALRHGFKMQGLVNISGFHVDPSYEGKLLFAVQNVGPSDVRLEYAQPTFSIFFAQLLGDIEN